MVSNSALFQPIKVGNHQLKHRFVFCAIDSFPKWHVGHATISHLLPNKAQPVSASNVAIQGSFMLSADKDYEVPHSLSIDEIAENHTGICQAAKNTVTAGFDGYRNPGCQCSNFRTDQYGGSTENRDRFTLEVVKAISAAIGTGRADIHLFPWSGYQVRLTMRGFEPI
ncbi:hypothetical protein BDC45DRAFT_533476 [Circinella umbellata]|nr:hypothetical protein BDC45DRAFT_533476 [Circinella umbellata]